MGGNFYEGLPASATQSEEIMSSVLETVAIS